MTSGWCGGNCGRSCGDEGGTARFELVRVALVSLILFLSGCSALLFQTLWLRLSGLAFGNSVWSAALIDRKSTRLNSSHVEISYAVFCLKKKKKSLQTINTNQTLNKNRIHSQTLRPGNHRVDNHRTATIPHQPRTTATHGSVPLPRTVET